MKKALLFIVIASGISGFAQAQISKGKILIGGNIAYYQSKSNNGSTDQYPAKQNYVTINPSVGKVIRENLVLGIEANYSSNSNRYNYPSSNYTADGKTYGGSVFLRKYVPLLQRFYFYGQGAAGFSTSNVSQESPQNNQKIKSENWGTNLTITPGLTYAITKKFYVEAGLNSLMVLGYNHQASESTDTGTGTVSKSNNNTINFSTNLGSNGGFSIGFRFLL